MKHACTVVDYYYYYYYSLGDVDDLLRRDAKSML
jgi:hypothetical protein